MPRKKQVLSSYQNQRIVTPLDHFIFEDDKFYLIIKGFESLKVFIKPAKASWGVEPRMADILTAWLDASKLPRHDWREWSKIVYPIIGYFDISSDNRILAYQLYRETSLAKLERLGKNLPKALKVLRQQPVLTMLEQEYIQKRMTYYSELYEKLKKIDRSGPQKFLYSLLSPFIKKLNNQNIIVRDQREHLLKLFDIGNFDSFKLIYTGRGGDFDRERAMNFITRIYREAAKLS